MAKDNNLQDFLTDIADAIREKKGTTEKINPQDFATEITNLSSGGSGESSGDDSNIEYLDVSGLDVTNKDSKYSFFGMYSNSIKAKAMGYIAFCPSGMYHSMVEMSKIDILAVAIDFNLPTNSFGETLKTTKEYILSFPGDFGFTEEELDAIPRITKEEFYNLEA